MVQMTLMIIRISPKTIRSSQTSPCSKIPSRHKISLLGFNRSDRKSGPTIRSNSCSKASKRWDRTLGHSIGGRSSPIQGRIIWPIVTMVSLIIPENRHFTPTVGGHPIAANLLSALKVWTEERNLRGHQASWFSQPRQWLLPSDPSLLISKISIIVSSKELSHLIAWYLRDLLGDTRHQKGLYSLMSSPRTLKLELRNVSETANSWFRLSSTRNRRRTYWGRRMQTPLSSWMRGTAWTTKRNRGLPPKLRRDSSSMPSKQRPRDSRGKSARPRCRIQPKEAFHQKWSTTGTLISTRFPEKSF